jgi:bacterioferritin (cytochrome b1)
LLEGASVEYDERGRVKERAMFHADALYERVLYKDGKPVREPAGAKR